MDVEVIWEYANNTGKTNGMFETYMLSIHYYVSKLVAYEIQATLTNVLGMRTIRKQAT